MRSAFWIGCALVLAMLVPNLVYAQASIAGVVRDSSNAVLPGVTVEVASPALIEKVRTTITDGAGAYRITELRSGTYTVTFTLTGFNATKRDGIEVSGNFVASVDAVLRVGAIEETVTVTGESPIVDTTNTRQQRVLNSDVIRDLPTSRQYYSVVTLIPGVVMTAQALDVGGSASPNVPDFVIHGGRQGDGRVAVDGISVGQRGGGGPDGGINRSMYLLNVGGVQETAITTSGGLGESETSGVAINLIPREGGNTHRGMAFTTFSSGTFQANNFDPATQPGLKTPNQLDKVWEVTVQEGGPIVKDRLWYYLGARENGNRNLVASMFYNQNAGDVTKWTYIADPNRRATTDDTWRSASIRLTAQPTAKDKVSIFWDEQNRRSNYIGGGTATQAPEATPLTISGPDRAYSSTWTRPHTNRLLLEAGVGGTTLQWGSHERPDYDRNLIQVTEQAGTIPGLVYRGMTWVNNWLQPTQLRGSASYVTGSHTVKVGVLQTFIHYDDRDMNPNPISYTFNGGAPVSLSQSIAPLKRLAHINTSGLYAQDQWRLNRLTVQAGVRYDHIHATFPEQIVGPVQWSPVASATPATDGASVHDITPRFAASWDVKGDGKTAVKVTVGRYVAAGEGGAWGEAQNPTLRISRTASRSWKDNNKDFVPDCNLLNPGSQSPATTGSIDTCGPYSDQNFGTLNYSSVYDPAISSGWGHRAYNWEFSTSIQREIVPRISAEFAYFRRSYGNQVVTENLAYNGQFGCGTPTDHSGCFSKFDYTVPVDPRLPNGGGYTLVGLQNVVPSAFGQTQNFVTSVDNFGGKKEYWQGLDLNVNARAFKGVTAQGGISTGRMTVDACNLAAVLPETFLTGQTLTFDPVLGTAQSPISACKVQEPFLLQFKGLASYLTPKLDILVSGTWQSIPGIQVGANFNAPNTLIQPILGRPLSGGAANIPVNLATPGLQYGDRINEVDLRFAKIFRYGRTRTNASVDLYNLLNTGTATTYNQTYTNPATNYLTPTAIVPARFVKFSVQFDW